jgi:hypothetical protein
VDQQHIPLLWLGKMQWALKDYIQTEVFLHKLIKDCAENIFTLAQATSSVKQHEFW